MSDLYNKLCQKAINRDTLSHYTDCDSLSRIVGNQSVKLNALYNVNDLLEHKRVDSPYSNKIFVACFTHRKSESYFFWKCYAKSNEGVLLRFPNQFFENPSFYSDSHVFVPNITTDPSHKSYGKTEDWGIQNVTLADIHYTRSINEYLHIDFELAQTYKDTIIFNSSNFSTNLYPGLVKTSEWNSEEETRCRVTLKPKGMEIYHENGILQYHKPPFDSIYLKLDRSILHQLTIILNPWATENFKNQIIDLIESKGLSRDQIRDSSLKGIIADKSN